MPKVQTIDVGLIARKIEELATDPPPEVTRRIQARINERRKGMPRGASRGELSLRVGY